VESLAEMLGDDDQLVRDEALLALGKMGKDGAEPLRRAMGGREKDRPGDGS
jgi:HEAT repeat protein